MEIIHGGLIEDTVMTKRDIYYRHPDLFLKQTVVDRYVDELACTFGITRSQLNVTAAAKGLVAGNFTIVRASGHQISAINETEGILVPTIGDNDILSLSPVRWILIIEKEVGESLYRLSLTNTISQATFQALLSSPQWDRLKPHGVALTVRVHLPC